MPQIKEITDYLESIAPLPLQESYDNAGLLVGNPTQEISQVLITLDITEAVVLEAVETGCNLIIAHHPIIFKGIKKLTGGSYIEKALILAIKNDVALYAIHTNLDHVKAGVNRKIAEKIGLTDLSILAPKKNSLLKLVTFAPVEATEKVLKALNTAGAGQIGDYKNCSFRVSGTGAFEPGEGANPHIGKQDQREEVIENRIEVILPFYLQNKVLQSLFDAHPYEEVAYYLSKLENQDQDTGAGMIGRLPNEMDEMDFLNMLKEKMALKVVKHTRLLGKKIKTVAVCGGAGGFLLPKAIQQQAEIFVSSDFKYHEFFDSEDKIIIADIGHYESEVYTKELIYELLNKNFTNIALNLSKEVTNPISYL